MLSFVWPALLIFSGYLAWHRWGADHMNAKLYRVKVQQIEVTPPPEYVRSNIVETVYEDTAMEGLSLMDSQATAKIASAFASHPWVQSVNSVRKLPGGQIKVRLDYRRPVAMVYVVTPETGDPGYFAVDPTGTVLPSEFTSEETRDYIHILIQGTYAKGAAGQRFGVVQVEAAARVAAAIAPYREQSQVKAVRVQGDLRETSVPQFELETFTGRKKFWGSAPGMELPNERSAALKMKVLLLSGNEDIDLRIATLPQPELH